MRITPKIAPPVTVNRPEMLPQIRRLTASAGKVAGRPGSSLPARNGQSLSLAMRVDQLLELLYGIFM